MAEASEQQPERERRLSITKLQRQSVAGAELISLCQSITEDAALTDFEILELESWLVSNQGADLPARDYLLSLVRQFAQDGEFSQDERLALYKAVESVLPRDLRATVRRTRVASEKRQRAGLLAARVAARESALAMAREAREAEKQARLRQKPLESLDFVVAGVVYEGRAAIVEDFCLPGNPVYLARDRANVYSRNAIEVRIASGMQIGFVPEVLACGVAPLLDAGHPHRARIKKIFAGARALIPVVLATIYRSDCGLSDIFFEAQIPAKVPYARGR
jgi:hypothetical protein